MTEKELQDRMAEAQAKAEKFERLHADGVIEHELRKAAEEGSAFNANQILTLLKGKSRLMEAGGKQVVRVVTVGDDGKETHHSPAQAIWHMKQDKSNANFFRDTMAATSTLAPPPAKPKLAWNNHEEYLKIRAEHPEVLGLNPLPKKGR
jgi:hypothetical protein